MSVQTAGELLFAEYLLREGMQTDREYAWNHTSKRPDHRYVHTNGQEIVIEQKDICVEPLRRSGPYDPYTVIRSHITAAYKQFQPFKGYPCILVLFARYASPHFSLSDPIAMLGAMYGDMALTLPYNSSDGRFETEKAEMAFVPGRGRMIQRAAGGAVKPQNARVSALLTLHHYDLQHLRTMKYARDHGAADVLNGVVDIPEEKRPGVTVWENIKADHPLPKEIFRGPLDRWWSVNESGEQTIAFTGSLLRELLPSKYEG